LKISQLYAIFQALSLDVVVGAGVGTAAVARYLGMALPPSVLLALASATWLIYTVDHLLDAQRLGLSAQTFRHGFHYRYRRPLRVIVAILLIVNGFNLLHLPAPVLKAGGLATVAVGAYFGLLSLARGRPSWFKELTIAFLYTAGVFLGPLSLATWPWPPLTGLLLLEYFLLAWLNLLLFAWYDRAADEYQQHTSLVRQWGADRVRRLSYGLAGLLLGLASLGLLMTQGAGLAARFQACVLLMATGLAAVCHFPDFFGLRHRYRVLGDAVFLLPAAVLA
jgi:hypothetical protein